MDPGIKMGRQSSSSPPRPDLSTDFNRDFRCCGQNLHSLPQLLQHYQEHHPKNTPHILRGESREETFLEQGNELANTSDHIQEWIQEDHLAQTGPTASPREQSLKRENGSPAIKEEAQEGDSPDRTNATGLSGSPGTYRQSTTRWSEARFSTSPSSYRPSTARSSTRRSLSPSEDGSTAVEERPQAELPLVLSDDDDDEVTFSSARTKPPDQVAETQGSSSRGSSRPLTAGSTRPDTPGIRGEQQQDELIEDLPRSITPQSSAPRKRKRAGNRRAENTIGVDCNYSVATWPLDKSSGDPYFDVNIASLRARLPVHERGALTNIGGVKPVAVTDWDRISLDITHPQELKALAIQVGGKPAPETCTRCSMSGPNKPDLIFAKCMIRKGPPGPCAECLFRHHSPACSLNPMRREDPTTAGARPCNDALMRGPSGERRGTRGSVRNREDDYVVESVGRLPDWRTRRPKKKLCAGPSSSTVPA